jgi:2'-5' RNA ligase
MRSDSSDRHEQADNDSDAYVEQDWQRYQALDRLVNHWQRPGWSNGRRSYYWLITFDNAPELRALAAKCQAKLQDLPMLDLVPVTSLHITLQRAGFVDELSRADAKGIAEAASMHLATMTPPTIRIGPLAGSPGAVRFSAGPHEPLRQIRTAVQAGIAEVKGTPPPESSASFVPHVSIAYSNADVSATPVIERVAMLRELGAVTVTVVHTDLVELRREGRRYAWEGVERVRLGGRD